MKTYKEYIKENINWNIKLMNSSDQGDLDGVKKALKNGADIHAIGDESLWWASSRGHLDVVKYLIENGEDIHSNDDYSLRWASSGGHLDVVKYLVENGADIHSNDDYSLRWASSGGHLDIVRYLISIYIERNKYKELLNHLDILPEEIKEKLKLKIPHIFAANDHGLI